MHRGYNVRRETASGEMQRHRGRRRTRKKWREIHKHKRKKTKPKKQYADREQGCNNQAGK